MRHRFKYEKRIARRKLLSYLYPTYLLITILAVVAVGFYASTAMRTFYESEVREDLELVFVQRMHEVVERAVELLPAEEVAAVDAASAPAGSASESADPPGEEK